MKKRVFVSSTFRDLQEYRRAVRQAVRQLGAEDVTMEYFGARDARPKQECVRLISEESDLFVGIYAHRFGFIPVGDQVSISESEYEAATSAGLPRLIYLVDPGIKWPQKLTDVGKAAAKLMAFKTRLQAEHICDFFSEPNELAAKVAADLGRIFSQSVPNSAPSPENSIAFHDERVGRLVRDLKSGDREKAARAIQALTPSRNPWLTQTLAEFVKGNDADLADQALSALRQIPGVESARAIAAGLNAPTSRIRSMAAFTLGEMALFGRRQDGIQMLDMLVRSLTKPEESLDALEEITHSLSKIGGEGALSAILDILHSSRHPARLKAKALHGPSRFWQRTDLGYHPSAPLYDRYSKAAKEAIALWSADLCVQVQQTSIFDYIAPALREAVLTRIPAPAPPKP
jgi:hypothetical protein